MDGITIIPNLFLKGDSKNYKNWQSTYLSITTCEDCRGKHGKIYDFNEDTYQPEHERCRCYIVPMRTKRVGTATEDGWNGADAWLMYQGRLPSNYITKQEAIDLGWDKRKKNLAQKCPGKMIGGDLYRNDELKLPVGDNRIWFEADFDFVDGFRNSKRILFSNDGLIFVSYDHAQTFYELIK